MAIRAHVSQCNKQSNFASRCLMDGFQAKCITAAVSWILFDTILSYSHPVLYK